MIANDIFLDAFTTRGAAGLLLLLGFCGLAIGAAKRRARPELAAGLTASLVCQQFVVFVVPTARSDGPRSPPARRRGSRARRR